MPTDEIIAPTTNPPGNGLINQPTTTSTSTPAIQPIASYTPALATPGVAKSTGYTSSPYAVPEKGLVQKQILDIAETNSPLLQIARRRASERMNERGLLNSSLNTTAGEEAVFNVALPIAQADAQAYKEAAFNTTNAENNAAQFKAGAENTAEQVNAQLLSSMNTTNANAKNAALNVEAQAQNARSLALIDNASKYQLAKLQADNQVLLQTDVNVANMFNQVVKNIADIANNSTLDSNAKKIATTNMLNLLNEGLRTTTTISGTDQAAITGLKLSEFFSTAKKPKTDSGNPAPPSTGTGSNGTFATPSTTPEKKATSAATWKPGMLPPKGYRVIFDGRSGQERLIGLTAQERAG